MSPTQMGLAAPDNFIPFDLRIDPNIAFEPHEGKTNLKTKQLKEHTAGLKQGPVIKSYPSYVPATPSKKLKEKLDRRENGQNSYSDQWDNLCDFIMANYPSFQIADFYANRKDIPVEEIPALFADFVAEKIRANHIAEIKGCYSTSVYEVRVISGRNTL